MLHLLPSRRGSDQLMITTPEGYTHHLNASSKLPFYNKAAVAPHYYFGADVHDAWRSTRLNEPDDRGLANKLYAELDGVQKVVCHLTGSVAVGAVYEHIAFKWPKRGFDQAFMYGAMHTMYHWFETARSGIQDSQDDYLRVLDKLHKRSGETDGYELTSPRYKEVDRRIMAVAMASLADPSAEPWQELPSKQRASLLGDAAVMHAVRDGQAILASVREGVPYDQSAGFAAEVISWQV